MARREKRGEKMDPEIASEGGREKQDDKNRVKSGAAVSSDDEEANEDLSLKLVEKHLLMRAASLAQDDCDGIIGNAVKNGGAVDPSSPSMVEPEVVVAGPSGASDNVVEDGTSDKKRVRIRKKKKKIEKLETGDQFVVVAKEEEKVETVEKDEKAVKAGNSAESVDPNSVETSVNVVLRKLLRGPRYFDPPDSNWQTCYNCGEEGHMAVNCASASKRKKPCFLCGSFDHGVRQCSKGQDCYICKKGGHRAKDCPEKYKSASRDTKACLKCGDSGHDMFSCRTNYSLDDLREIQCYVCKSFGHLCCVNYAEVSRELSCFKCGQLGHTGLACSKVRGETTDIASPSSCFKCGEEGHFARECTSSAKVRKRNAEFSTPTFRPHREKENYAGLRSAPPDLGKSYKKKKTKYEEREFTTPQKSKQRGGWIMEDPRDYSNGKARRNHWRPPAKASSSSKGHRNISSPQSSTRNNFHHRYGASRFDNSGSDGIRRNYNWW